MVLRLSLPSLRVAMLEWSWPVNRDEDPLIVNDQSFCKTHKLQKLVIMRRSLELAPQCFSMMPALTQLPLQYCGLTAVPEAVTSLRTSLRLLDINHNRGLRFTKESKARVLQLHILRSFYFGNGRDRYRGMSDDTPAGFQALWWSGDVMELMTLQTHFATLHGHHLMINLVEAAPQRDDD